MEKRSPPSQTRGNFFFANLLPVTLDNILGGAVFVAFAYWFIHLSRGSADGA